MASEKGNNFKGVVATTATHRYAHLFFLVFISSSFYLFVGATPVLIEKDLRTMRDISKHLPVISTTLNYWNTTHPNPCLWGDHRVTCSSSSYKSFSRVKVLDFYSLGLYTSTSSNSSSAALFFELLCRLDALETLDLARNSFTSIPTSFFSNCSGLRASLKRLYFYDNQLSGPLYNFSSFHTLEVLDVSQNTFEGQVSPQLDGLVHLKVLWIGHNLLNGTIPVYPNLEIMYLHNNLFDGPIPYEIFHSTNLTLLDLSRNKLTGSIPDEIGNLSKLEILDLCYNHLTGTITASLSSIKTLREFLAYNNYLSGRIPTQTTRFLKVLDLSFNYLNGEIPPDLLSPPNLRYALLESNHLEGPLPQNFSRNLNGLSFSNNLLNGNIPSEIMPLRNLMYLHFDGNKLHGEIPHQLENCQSLAHLNLAANQLQGNLPKELGDHLQSLTLQANKLSGEIPAELSKLVNLTILDLSHNSFTGAIPTALFSLKKLSSLNLEGNQLNGSISNTIVNLNSLSELRLGNNMLGGAIPRMPTSLSTSLNLSTNLFRGLIPSYLGILFQLQLLDLSSNNFTGEVPYTLTTMENLTQLVLSYNQLSGVVPQFHSSVTVVTAGNNFSEDEVTGNKEGETTRISIGKQAILIMIAAFVSGFVVAILVARAIQEVFSRCFYRAKKGCTAAGRRNTSPPFPSNNFEKMRVRHQLYVANRGGTKSRVRNSGI